MFNTICFLFVLSVLIVVHEYGHFIVARRLGVKVERFSFGFGPTVFSRKRGDTEYRVSLFLIGGYIKMAGETPDELKGDKSEYLSRKPYERAMIVMAGPILNYALAFGLFFVVCLFGDPVLSTKIGKVLDGMPAQKAGILVNDRVLQINGNKIDSWDMLTSVVHKSKDIPLGFKIQRQTQEIDVVITPTSKKTSDTVGRMRDIGVVGIVPTNEIKKIRYGLFDAPVAAMEKLLHLSGLTYLSLWGIASGGIPIKDSLTGPIGIFFITGEAARMGFVFLLNMMGILSMSLAIFNILPFPVLDGGHLLFLSLEGLRGRPISQRFQEAVTQLGVFLLVFAMLFVFYNDLVRFGIIDKILGR